MLYEKKVCFLKTLSLFDLTHTKAGNYLADFEYPWQALSGIKAQIQELGAALGAEYTEISPQVWVHKTATVAPTATAAPRATTAPEPTKEPEAKTYTAYVEDSSGEVPNVWEIKGVFAEGTYQPQNGFPLPLRVFYVTEENAATLLRDLYPGDYAYRGAFYVNAAGDPCGDYNAMKPYGNFEQYIKDEEPCIRQGGYYKNLPKGSWYFGSVRFSDGFIVVVGDADAAQNGTVPKN